MKKERTVIQICTSKELRDEFELGFKKSIYKTKGDFFNLLMDIFFVWETENHSSCQDKIKELQAQLQKKEN